MVSNDTIDFMYQKFRVFTWIEYTLFISLLAASALIGVYYAYKPKKRSETFDDYMLGGRKMPLWPVACSLVASFVSSVSLLGIPAETYRYGTQLFGIALAIIICGVLLNIFYLPVIYELQFKSLYEYLERRFDKRVRQATSFIFAVAQLSHIPVIVYVAALAFNQVTGVEISILAPLICGICIFYTSIGGLKAVVWSDFLQGAFAIVAVISILLLGINSVGGYSKMIELNQKGERLELFNMDPDPFKRNTFWTTCVGSIPHWLKVLATHPSTVQRYICVPTYQKARLTTIIMVVGIFIVKGICTLNGLVLYAKYHDCDPLAIKRIQKNGQILPYFIMDVSRDYPGLAGVFLAGVVSMALSAMSSGLNTLCGTIYEDFLKPILPWKQTNRAANLTMKFTVVILGILTTLLVFVVERLGTIMQMSISLHGVTTGIQLYVFTLGMFVPWANSKGALVGGAAGFVSSAWVMTGAQWYAQRGMIRYEGKVTSIENCPSNITESLGLNSTRFGFPGEGTITYYADEVPSIYRISYLYYSLIGFTVSMIVGMIVSILTGVQKPSEVDPRLIVPQLRRFLGTKEPEVPPVVLYKVVPTKEPATT